MAAEAELPTDPDLEQVDTAASAPRHVHLRPSSIVLVLVGGTVGTGAREALSLAIPAVGGVPYAIFAINVMGAFLLGVLLDALALRGPDEGRRRSLRLLLGTGFMGGFTTYSALATDTAYLIGDGSSAVGTAYALGTVVVGAVATLAGVASAAALTARSRPEAAR